jgi:Trk K+ transport system NAD-binding subunit
MPKGSLVALIRRKGETIIPRGQTVLEEGDRLTIIGDAHGIEELNNEYS